MFERKAEPHASADPNKKLEIPRRATESLLRLAIVADVLRRVRLRRAAL
jgi:hypothetical protein